MMVERCARVPSRSRRYFSPDFGIAHLSVRESHGGTRRIQRRPRHLAEQAIEAGRLRFENRVVLAFFAAAESVDDDENEEGALRLGHGAADDNRVGKSGCWD